MKIVELKASTKVKGRYLVKLEEGTLLRVSQQELVDFALYQGMELSVEEAQALEKAAQTSGLKSKAMNALTRRPMSRRDLEKKLTEWEASEEEASAICDRMEEIGMLNEVEFASRLAGHCHRKGYGLSRIKQEFYKHGVPRDLWEDALEEFSENDQAIDRFILQKCKGEKPDQKLSKKVSDALARRGFSWSEIRSGFLRYDETMSDQWELE